MINKALYTSNTDNYETPQYLFDILDDEFRFTVDVCARADNTKCAKFFSPEIDGLAQSWKGEICWMNPPYGKKISKWVEKAYKESQNGAIVVGLLPARTDTKWFHDFILGKAEIRFLKGRLKFNNVFNSAPFPSMIVIWRGRDKASAKGDTYERG